MSIPEIEASVETLEAALEAAQKVVLEAKAALAGVERDMEEKQRALSDAENYFDAIASDLSYTEQQLAEARAERETPSSETPPSGIGPAQDREQNYED